MASGITLLFQTHSHTRTPTHTQTLRGKLLSFHPETEQATLLSGWFNYYMLITITLVYVYICEETKTTVKMDVM